MQNKKKQNSLNSLEEINFKPPDKNTSEISIFGPGIGECVVIHSNGYYYIVDSCLEKNSKRPIALLYLEQIGVNYQEQVKGIIISHWHTDHISGMNELIQNCPNAKIWFSDALIQKEAIKLVSLYSSTSMYHQTDDDISEFVKTIDALKKTNVKKFESISARVTVFDRRNIERERLVALSPSSHAIKQSIQQLVDNSKDREKINTQRKRFIVPLSSNLNAVALIFESNGKSVLLGSDLEINNNRLTGWFSIIDSELKDDLSINESFLYKVAHHGSLNGHCDDIIDNFLTQEHISVITPYSRCKLPTEDNIERIKFHSKDVFITAMHNAIPPERMRNVDKLINSVAFNRETRIGDMGHIQIRWKDQGDFMVCGNKISKQTI